MDTGRNRRNREALLDADREAVFVMCATELSDRALTSLPNRCARCAHA